jgi:hypothetical protein
MNNYIGIDISLNSTAIFIISNLGQTILSFNGKADNNIYIKELSSCGVKMFRQERKKDPDYSTNEVIKIYYNNQLSREMVDEILKYIDTNHKTYCQIEGYSFSKDTSSILDIVSLSSMIRGEIAKRIPNLDIKIISPSTLKLETCKLVYLPIDIGIKKPKLKWVNGQGISGGSFKKPQMLLALIESGIETPISPILGDYSHLVERDKIPNPIEDIVDSIFACLIRKKEIESL